jgi:hypothetical protein
MSPLPVLTTPTLSARALTTPHICQYVSWLAAFKRALCHFKR